MRLPDVASLSYRALCALCVVSIALPAFAQEDNTEESASPAQEVSLEEESERDSPSDVVEQEDRAEESAIPESSVHTVGATVANDVVEPASEVIVQDDDTHPWQISLGGYFRFLYSHIQSDPNLEFVGRNDGFVFGDARLIIDGQLDNGLGFVLSLDAASGLLRRDANSPVTDLSVRMADAFMSYAPFPYLEVQAGQFKAPFDVEELIPNADLLFANRSLGNRGVALHEGRFVPGISMGREIGVQVLGQPYFFLNPEDGTGPGISYALAATNGYRPNTSINNKSQLAYYGRGALHYSQYVALGGAYFYNDNTIGTLPDRIDLLERGWTADLQVNVVGISLLANIIQRTSDSPDIPQEGKVTARAYQLQLAYEEPFLGLQPAYRYAFYDPTFRYAGQTVDSLEVDALTHHTLGLNYNATRYPLRLMVNYTIAQEHAQRSVRNNRTDVLVQMDW